MPSEDFLVTTSIGSKSQKLIWRSAESHLRIDEYTKWVLEKTDDGMFIHGYDSTRIKIDETSAANGEPIALPPVPTKFGSRQLQIRLYPLRTIAPVYVTPCRSVFDSARLRPNQLFVFRGIRNYIVSYNPGGDAYRAYVERRPVFAYRRDDQGCQISALQEGVTFSCPGAETISLDVRKPVPIDDLQLTEGRICWRHHWWRVARIPMPESIPLRVLFEEDLKESLWYRRIARTVALGFLAISFCAILYPRLLMQPVKPKPPTQVALKVPKEMPKAFEIPKPVEIPKPPPPVVKAEPPPRPKPEKKITAAPPPPPAPAVRPTPAPVVQAPKPPSSAQAQAELAKSLNFLSPSMNKPKALVNSVSGNRNFQAAAVVDPKATSILKDLSKSTTDSSPIDTRAARNINGAVAVGGKNKSLNQVMGRVSLNSLYSSSNSGELGNAISGAGTGMALSGEGKLPESLVQKVLAKYIEKFQYCYEKALLADSSLSGSVVMQWSISMAGQASDIKVIRSQMNNAGLHNCLSRELSRIKFPAPTGGSVTVKYPFAFSSSTI
jgi:hypothetical protein